MKLTFAFFAVLAVSGFLSVNSVPVSTKTVREHLRDFVNLIPVEDLENLFYDYMADDEDFAETLDYVLSDEFKSHVITIEGAAEFRAYLNFLEKLGIPAYEYANKVNERLEIDPIAPLLLSGRSSRITGGLPGFFKDVKALLPIDAIQKLYNEKMANAPEFAELDKSLKSDECYALFGKLVSNPTIKGLLAKAKAKGVDIQAILDFISSIFGFKFPPFPVVSFASSKSLVQHFEDFVALMPTSKFEDLYYDYLAEDEDFAVTLDYLLGDEFQSQLQSIESTSEFKDHLNFFENFGLPAYEYVNKLNAFLNIDPITPLKHTMSNRISGGLPGFFKDIRALLPVEAIQKLYNEKLSSAPEFAEFANKLQSEEYFNLVDKMLDNEAIQKLIGKAENKGVDFEAILDFIGSVFGFKIPRPEVYVSRSLQEDFEEFKKLIPVKAIEDLFYDYMAEDEDFAIALDFLQGDAFKAQVVTVESTAEFKEYLNFLELSGIPAYEYVNKLNAFLNIDLITPLRHIMSNRITGGLPGFLHDIRALLPEDKIQQLYKEKLQSSDQFAELVERLQSDECYNLFAKLLNVPTIQDLLKLAESKGVDLEAIIEFISSMFGFKFPPRP